MADSTSTLVLGALHCGKKTYIYFHRMHDLLERIASGVTSCTKIYVKKDSVSRENNEIYFLRNTFDTKYNSQ